MKFPASFSPLLPAIALTIFTIMMPAKAMAAETCETVALSEEGLSDTILPFIPGSTEEAIGDLYIWNNPATIDGVDGPTAVRVEGSCVRNKESGENGAFGWNCNAQYVFEDGRIFVAGSLPASVDDSIALGITGGTGKYNNVVGSSMVFFPTENNIAGLWRHDLNVCTKAVPDMGIEMIALSEQGISDTILFYNSTSGEDGIGDLYIWNNPASMSGEDTDSLRIQGSCVRNQQQDGNGDFAWNCLAQYNFDDGTVFLAGGLPQTEGASFVLGVLGGNGRYRNVAGESTVFFPVENNIDGLWQHDLMLIFNEGEAMADNSIALSEEGISDTILFRNADGETPGIGDLYIWNNAATKAGDDTVVRIQGSCVRTQEDGDGAFAWNCAAQYNFAEGDIFVSGGLPETLQDATVLGITGGSGIYDKASGESTVFFPAEDNIAGLWMHDLQLCCAMDDGEMDGVSMDMDETDTDGTDMEPKEDGDGDGGDGDGDGDGDGESGAAQAGVGVFVLGLFASIFFA